MNAPPVAQGTEPITLSVIMPAYNAATWLPKSIPILEAAMQRAHLAKAEIIIVNDGSTDDTEVVARHLKTTYPLRVVSQSNGGRFLARDTGVKAAKYEYVLFIDTRIYIGQEALAYVTRRLDKAADRLVWTSHVLIDKEGNMFARFWEAITFISWRRYFAHPRECAYGIKDFDYYPKGTTCFFVPRTVIAEANNWFRNQTKNERASNDDTLLIRRIAETHLINLSPEFFVTYHARTSLKQYSNHVYHRGKVFVDGFLRRDGNRFFWPLVAFLVLSVAVPVAVIVHPAWLLPLLMIAALGWLLELVAALALSVPPRDAVSLFVLSPLFFVLYGAGIWTAVYDIYVRRGRKASNR